MYALSPADVQAVLDSAAELLAVDHAEDLPGTLLSVVGRLVPSDSLSYNEVDVVRAQATIVHSGDPPDPDAARWFAAHAHENPVIAHHQTTGDRGAVRMSDFITTRELHRRPIYHFVYRPLGVECQLAFGLAGPGPTVGGVALNRGRPDFTARDVAVLELLRPFVAQIFSARRGAADPAVTPPRLTPRQRQIVALLADGASNAQIAAALGIAPRTVGKHLEHVYRALGVSNRTSAVARLRHSPY